MRATYLRGFVLLGTLCLSLSGQAQEFRQLNRIATPGATQGLPAGASVLTNARPVPIARIESSVKGIAAAWNTQQLDSYLAKNFNDRSRLLDTLNASVPRDASLRVLSIQGSQTLLQYTQRDPDGTQAIHSRVSVTVRTQVEFTDTKGVFQRLDGTNDLILLFSEPQT